MIDAQSSKYKLSLDRFLSVKDDSIFLSLNDDKARQQFIDSKIEEQFSVFKEISVKTDLGILEWLGERGESCIRQFNNKPQFMGRTIDGKIYLNNEETLFLIEKNCVICYFKSLQLSLQDAFGLMIKNNIEFERYMIYSYLIKFGYRVRRCNFKKEKAIKQTNLKNEKMNEDNGNSIKRSIDIEERFLTKRTKLIEKDNLDEDSFKEKIKIIPLNQLVNDLHLISQNNELDFLKFIRFKKLTKTSQNYNWQSLEDEFKNSKSHLNKSSFVVEELDCIKNVASLGDSKNRMVNQLYNDFLSDSPLIKFNESLTENEIQQRLANYAPRLDVSDCFSNHLLAAKKEDNSIYDFDVYLPNKRKRIQDSKPDFLLKILHTSQFDHFPIYEIFQLNAKIENREKLLFAVSQGNEFNFFQFTDVDITHCI